MQVVLTGAGGHAKVIADIIEQAGEFEIAGFTCSGPALREYLGYPVLGANDSLAGAYKGGLRHAFAAIGDNATRKKIAGLLESIGFALINAISPRAIVSPRATLGRGIAVMPGAVINAGAEIGDGAIINTGAIVDHDCSIASFAHIAPGCALAGNIHIAEGAFLGAGVSVIPGMSVGEWTTVGAGAVVISNLESYAIAVGVPARVMKSKLLQA